MKLVYTYPGSITRKGVEFAHGVPTEVPATWAPGDTDRLRAAGCVYESDVQKPSKGKSKIIVDDGDPVPQKPKRGVKRKRSFGDGD